MTSSSADTNAASQTQAAACVRALLERHGAPRHKHSALVAGILGISYSHAHRKVQKDSAWSLEELTCVAAHFGESLAELVSLGETEAAHSAVLQLGSTRVPCRIWLDGEAACAQAGSLVAIHEEGGWIVMPCDDKATPGTFNIRLLVLQGAKPTARRIAVLDDNKDHTDSLVSVLADAGFDASPFYAAANLASAIQEHPFDGYLIDWIVGNRDTGELIAGIRETDTHCPIGVLTGEFDTGRAQAQDVASAVQRLKLMFFEKPLRLPIIAAQLTQAFGAR